MLSVPSVYPKGSHDIWYTPSCEPHVIRRSTKPKSQFLPGSTAQDDEEEPGPSSSRPGVHSVPLTALESAEAELVQDMESIRTFGFTFLRPPGFTKTEQALLEEQTLSDSESDDNGLIENPNGELVMIDGEEGPEQEEIGEEDEEELEAEDNEDEEELDEDEVAEEALDGWPRRQRRRRYRVNTDTEEVDLDADIPEGEDLGMDYDEEDYEEGDEGQDGYDEESREMETPGRETTAGFAVPSDDDYEMGMEFDEDED
ncbi:hypothetical protein V1515DRAFT_196771 [Lipomyces mesembrius]